MTPEKGSQIAKEGFQNEVEVKTKFENWKRDKEAKIWLNLMGYCHEDIVDINVILLSNRFKSDIQVQIEITLKHAIDIQNISIKKLKKDLIIIILIKIG